MSGSDNNHSKKVEQSPGFQDRDFWYDSIQKGDDDLQGRLNVRNESIDDSIKLGESGNRNKIGLLIVITFCAAFLLLFLGCFSIFSLMVAIDTTYNVPLVIDFMKEYAGLLKDGFLPIVLVALGYFFGSNNSK